MTRVDPGTWPYKYVYVNSVADYYGGAFNGTPPSHDAQGYQKFANPMSGCSGNVCCPDCQNFAPTASNLTIGPTMGISVFLGLCDESGNSALFVSALDRDTKHVGTCNYVLGNPKTMQGGFFRTWSAPVTFALANPLMGCGIFPITPEQCTYPDRFVTQCGACCGFLNNFTNPPEWNQDHVTYDFGPDWITFQGGSGQCLQELLCLGSQVPPFEQMPNCVGSCFNGNYTLSISGDFGFLNGSYNLAYMGGAPPSWGTVIVPPFTCCNPFINTPNQCRFGCLSAVMTANTPSWSVGIAGLSLPIESGNCSPLFLHGAANITSSQLSLAGLSGCDGVPDSGTIYWTVS